MADEQKGKIDEGNLEEEEEGEIVTPDILPQEPAAVVNQQEEINQQIVNGTIVDNLEEGDQEDEHPEDNVEEEDMITGDHYEEEEQEGTKW